jgi:hypothetical protein
MRAVAPLLLVTALLACGPGGSPPAEEAAPAELTLADFAGTWETTSQLTGIPDPVPSTLIGSAGGDDWTMTLEGRPGIPLQVSIVGDSLIAQSVEYESVLRPGVMVTVRTASAMQGDMLNGTLVATYRTPDGEEIVTGTTTSRRIRQ